MNQYKIIDRATNFGTFRSRNDFFSFTLKMILYIIPALLIGHYTDIYINKMKIRKILGEQPMYYIVSQTMFNIIVLYLFILILPRFMSEFQMTISGGYFIFLYFSIQTNYMKMLKKYMNSFIYL